VGEIWWSVGGVEGWVEEGGESRVLACLIDEPNTQREWGEGGRAGERELEGVGGGREGGGGKGRESAAKEGRERTFGAA
jgi:hypothetical protein